MLIRGSLRLSWRRCVLVPAVLVGVALTVITSAAPVSDKVKVTSEEAVVKGESEKPLVRAKRADEIIFDNVQNVAGASSSSASSPVKKSDQRVDAKTDDVTKAVEKQQETAQRASEADESDVGNGENAPADESSDTSSDDSASESADSVTWDSDTDDADKRRRRSASGSIADGVAAADRTKREAGAAMVAENMAVGGIGNSRLQRAKRDLDADDIREIFEAGQPLTESAGDGQGVDYGQPEYGSPAQDYADTIASPSDEVEDEEEPEEEEEGGDYEDAAEDNVEEEFDNEGTPEQLRYVGRPKRRSTLTDDEREEALESAERQVIRELLAERAAEETRQALINYLTGYDQPVMSQPSHEIVERYDERFRDEGFDDEGYSEDDEDNSNEENGYEEDEEGARENDADDGLQEALVENGDGGFLAEEPGADGSDIEEQSPSMVEQKRFSYPYSYEPYGGRWGALVPGAKRDDHDPYDRLYRLAEALSRPSPIGGDGATDDEYKK